MLSALAIVAALSAAWAPAAKFSLVCTGTQTGYQELGGSKVSLPWAETFTIDLGAGTYCSQGCAVVEPIASIGAAELDLDNASTPAVTSIKRFQVATGAYQSAEFAGQTTDRFHIEKTGTCTIKT